MLDEDDMDPEVYAEMWQEKLRNPKYDPLNDKRLIKAKVRRSPPA